MKKKIFIIALNPIDCLTLSGLIIALCSAVLILNGLFSYALSLLFLAMLADAFDGILSRKFGFERNFGRYLDGFVDVFDYLALPALFLYLWGFNTWYYGIILVIFISSGIIRLSVFNDIGNIKDNDDKLSYLGMPVFWSILFLGILYPVSWFLPKESLFPFIAILFSIFSFFMIYNEKFFKFKSIKSILIIILSGLLVFTLHGANILNEPINYVKSLITTYNFNIHFVTALLLMIPVVIGGSLHMMAVSKNWLPSFAIPVNNYFFGANKTWRGFILMIGFSILGSFLLRMILAIHSLKTSINIQEINVFFLGTVLGGAYILFELPNSFLKRKLGIKPGEHAEKYKALFIFLDQCDSAIGLGIFSYLFFDTPPLSTFLIVVFFPVVAIVVKQFLFLLKWKEKRV